MKLFPKLLVFIFFLASFLQAEDSYFSSWSVTVKGGPAFPVMGDVTGRSAAFPTTTTNDEGEVVTTGEFANMLGVSWSDAYKDFRTIAVEVDFWERPTRSFYLGVSHTQATGKSALLGTFNDRPVNASFSDYSDTTFYLGARWGVGYTSWIKSLLSVQVGAAVVDAINAEVTNLPNVDRLGLYQRSTVFSGGLFLSVIITPLDFLEVGIDGGFIYQSVLKKDSAQVDFLGLQGLNSEGDLGIVPVRVMATIKF